MDSEPLDVPPSQMVRRPRVGLILGAFVLIAAGIGGALYVADKKEAARKADDVNGAWSRLSSCLIGDPLGERREGERALSQDPVRDRRD